MAIPNLTPLPDPPLPTDAEATFDAKAGASLLAQQEMVEQLNASTIPGINQAVTAAESARDAAASSATAAEGSVTAAAQQVSLATEQNGLAVTARQGSEDARDQAQIYASAAGAAAGLPALAGNKFKALVVKEDETGVEYKAIGQDIGDVLLAATPPASSYLPANGGIYLQSSYPALFSKVGTSTNIELTQPKAGVLSGSQTSRSVAYGAGRFVMAVGDSVLYSSTDGISWTAKTGLPNSLSSVSFSNGRFLAFANSSTSFVYSTDGLNWTTGSLPSAATIYSVTYGSGIYVAVGNSVVYTSTDAIAWVARTPAFAVAFFSVVFAFGMFIAIDGANNPRYMTSTDGITWVSRSLPVNPLASSYCAALLNGVLVVSCSLGPSSVQASTSIMRTVDGVNWTVCKLPFSASWSGLVAAGGKFLTMAVQQSAIASSVDGIDWQHSPAPGSVNNVDSYSGARQCAASPSMLVVAQGTFSYLYQSLYSYDPATQFATPVISASGVLKAYIKFKE